MAKLKTLTEINTHRVFLPSTADAPDENDRVWLDIKDSLLLSDKIDASVGDSTGDKIINGLASIITAWNYTEDGTPDSPMIPITGEIIDAQIVDPEDVKLLVEEYSKTVQATQGLSVDEKKTSLDTTPPASTPEVDPTLV